MHDHRAVHHGMSSATFPIRLAGEIPAPAIRVATAADDAVMDAIAREGDASADANYLALVRS
jgi:hypothetical protein